MRLNARHPGRISTVLAAILAAHLFALPARADVNTDANALFVQAVQAWEAAGALPAEQTAERLELLQSANRNLEQIITDLPGSDLAVRLITGETLGPITLQGSRDALADLTSQTSGQGCATAPTPDCLIDAAVAAWAMTDEPALRERPPILLIEAMVKADQLDRALAILADYPFAETYYSHMPIVDALGQAGQIDAAMAIVQQAEDPEIRSRLLSHLAAGLATAGRVDEAELILKDLTAPLHRFTVLVSLGQFDQMDALIATAPPDKQDFLLGWMAAAAADAGLIDLAQTTRDRLSVGDDRRLADSRIAKAQARAGLLADAIETLQDISDPLLEILELWRIDPDPAYVAELQKMLGRTPENTASRRSLVFAMNILDPRPEYLAELRLLDSALDAGQIAAPPISDIRLLTLAGHYADAAALVLALPEDAEFANRRSQSIATLAWSMAMDPALR
jgi:hypothetical protein